MGVVTDVQYGTVLAPPIAVRDGDYSDLAGASVVMITAGVNEKEGGATDRSDPVGRLRLLEENAVIFLVMSDAERQGLQRSAEALSRLSLKESQRRTP